ncbi:arrestin [Ilyonectria destructans]|nr:arrestin [Ilyonectria destructans]
MSPSLGSRSEPESTIEIKIDHHFNSKVYTCGSAIAGCVLITPQKDIPFDTFQIIFSGTANTSIDFLQRSAPPTSQHTFLQQKSQIWRGHLPESRIFEAGQSYSVPFAFIVPFELDPRVCHDHCRATVQPQHLRLPPSMGGWEAHDHSPDISKIDYSIKAKIFPKKGKPMESLCFLRVLPLFPEEPPIPLHLAPDNDRYRLTQAKMIRPSLFSSKIGNLRVSATQPSPIILSADALSTSASTINLNLEFTPTLIGGIPPSIHSITAKIYSTTFFSLTHINYQPDFGTLAESRICPITPYTTGYKISTDQLGKPVWEQQHLSRKSFLDPEDLSLDQPVAAGCLGTRSDARSPSKHTATMAIPFKLPTSTKLMFLPTFHSCIISRTYAINLKLSTGPSGTALSLEIPLQIGVDDATNSSMTGLPVYVST